MLAVAEDAVRQKWRGLRDTFRKELCKLEKKRSGDAADDEVSCKWQYFSSMFFIKDQFTPRKTSGNIPDIRHEISEPPVDEAQESLLDAAYSESEQSHLQTEVNVETDAEATFTRSSHSRKPLLVASNLQHTSTPSKRKRNEKDSALQKLIRVEEEKLRYFKQNSEKLQDDDRYFALSLVPYLRQLPTHRKMFARAKFQEILAQDCLLYTSPWKWRS